MIQIDRQYPEKAIINFIREWFRLLSSGDLREACIALDEATNYGHVWTPTSIELILNEVFSDDTIFYREFGPPRFSDPDELSTPKLEAAGEFDDGSGYWFDYPVPLNGQWSDLTAQFEFHEREKGFAVILQDLHVL
ncbi:MAG: hypothetical protein IPM21_10660 [Acidobacteria bacterium]|nr:hypothetical protein [Acidobacteriota bacterium]